MASKINPMEPRPARVTPVAAVRAADKASAAPNNDTPADVHVTGAARNLAAIEQTLRAQPPVDELRVSAVRQRLQDGSYQVDAQRVADRLLRLENDLAAAGPFAGNPLR